MVKGNKNLLENIGFIIAIILIVVSISTYIMPILGGGFDFGLVLEVLSLVLVIAAKNYLSKNNLNDSMVSAKVAILLIAILLIYDIVQFVNTATNLSAEVLNFILEELIFIAYIIVLSILSIRISKRMDLEMGESDDRDS